MARLLRITPVAWLVLLLVLPGVAWLAGARQPELGNVPRAQFPKPTTPRAFGDAALYAGIDAALLDRFPFREQALEARGRIGVQLFHDSTHPDVHIGNDGWLYYLPELQTCGAPGIEQIPDALELMAGTIIASGRNAVVTVAGSKMLSAREHLDEEPDRLACIATVEAGLHDRLARIPGGLDLQREMARQRDLGRHVFLKNDTHWNGIGRRTFARSLLERIRPGLAREAGVVRAPQQVEEQGDLARFLGLPLRDRFRPTRALRTPASPGPVLLIGDSQAEGTFDRPGPDGVTLGQRVLGAEPVCPHSRFATGNCDERFRAAEHVAIEIVARNAATVLGWCPRVVSLAGETLRGRPGRWRPLDGGRQQRELTLEAGSAQQAVTLPGGNRVARPRLIRIPVRTLPQETPGAAVALTAGGIAAPCATPAQAAEGGALFVPVPAGVDAAPLTLSLAAPAGTVLGAPEEIVLGAAPRSGR